MSASDRPLMLVVGIGNPDRGDDGVGPVIVRRLRGRVPPGTSVRECSGDALALIEDWKGFSSVIVVDAMTQISEPGRIHRLELTSNPLARRGLQGYIFQTGQPAEVRAAFLAAMGFSEEEATADPRPFDPLAPAAR